MNNMNIVGITQKDLEYHLTWIVFFKRNPGMKTNSEPSMWIKIEPADQQEKPSKRLYSVVF